MNNKGQALIESLFVLQFIIAIAVSALMLSYLLFSHFALKRNIHQTLVCLHEVKKSNLCKSKFVNNFNLYLPLSQISSIDLELDLKITNLHLQWCPLSWSKNFFYCKNKTYSLSTNSLLKKMGQL